MKTKLTLLLLLSLTTVVSAQDTENKTVTLSKSESLKSGANIQFKVRIELEGVKCVDSKVLFEEGYKHKMPIVIIRSGEQSEIIQIKEYASSLKVEDRPFAGVKVLIKPTFDFITGKVINTGKLVFSRVSKEGKGKLNIDQSLVEVAHDFRSWTKHWSGIGGQKLTLQVDDGKEVKIHIHFDLIDAGGDIIKIKR